MAVRIESNAEPLPGYRLIDRLGGGGFGEVWRVEAPGGLHKAIKFVFGDLEDFGDEDGQRAEQELKALSRVKSVRHPYILSLERFDIIDGKLMIVMELADRSLWDRFRECRAEGLPGIPRDELLRYMAETAEAIDVMNVEYQLQHLDIKPQNLFLVSNHIKVADFGLVKDLEGMVASVTGGVTPVYAAPETFDGYVSRRCDQYSLAIVYQELLTGRRPFTGSTVRQLVLQHMQSAPDLAPLPEEDREIIARALAKNPDERYPSCQELVDRLNQVGPRAPGEPVGTPPWRPGSQSATARTPSPLDAPGALPGPPITPPNSPVRTVGGTVPAAQQSILISPPPHSPVPPAQPPPSPEFLAGIAPTQWVGMDQDPRRPTSQSVPTPPPAVKGTGALLPAVVIAVGQTGLHVLQQLRELLHQQFGPLDTALPQLRLLYLDTDPETVTMATRSSGPAPLSGSETLLTRIQRVSHYVKPTSGRVPVDSWLDPKMLYRIPRTQTTGGLRALGRLAFCDNYRLIAHRLASELQACVGANLKEVADRTNLGIRTNRPRVYVLASLAGGTGSGMFIDLGYLARWQLRSMGYHHPDVVGLFFLPKGRGPQIPNQVVANTYAALTELQHYSSPGITFSAQYEPREPAVVDENAPFRTCCFLPQELRAGDGQPAGGALQQAADFLARDLTSLLGRELEDRRTGGVSPPLVKAPTSLTFAMQRLAWPRHAIIKLTSRSMLQRLLLRWMSKEATPALKESVRLWLGQELEIRGMTVEQLIEGLHAASDKAVGRRVEEAFKDTIAPALAMNGDSAPFEPLIAHDALVQVQNLLEGRAQEDDVGNTRQPIGRVLRDTSELLGKEWTHKYTQLVGQLIENPEFRLAGAEEAIRVCSAQIEKTLHHHETLAREMTARVQETTGRIQAHLSNIQKRAVTGKRLLAAVAEVHELIRQYPRQRYQLLVLQRVVGIHVSLRGHLSDQVREVNFCRSRLAELRNRVEGSEAEAVKAEARGGFYLIPHGHSTIGEAARDMLRRMDESALLKLDQRIQTQVLPQFRSLTQVCLGSANLLRPFETALIQEVEAHAGSLLECTNVCDLLLQQFPDAGLILKELKTIIDSTRLELGDEIGRAEPLLIAIPAVPAGEQIHAVVAPHMPETQFYLLPGIDDIVFYRECPILHMQDLEQFGPDARDAYDRMSGVEHLTPHSRTDVSDWTCPVAF